MRETEAHPNALVPVPALHAYTTARGPFEDSTNWDATWVPGVSNVTSTVSDLGRWTRLQYSLLSAKSRKVATAPSLAGTGPLTKSGYYIFGTIAARGWWVSNPQLMGYTGAVGYMPAQKLSVVVFATNGPKTNPVASPATAAFLDITKALTPRNVPGLSVEPRGASGNQ
jgi:D-alanyl-D-alanine carboxypeptidase